MNILFVVTNLEHANGGVCTHVIDLCREYVRNFGHNVVIVADGTDYSSDINGIGGV